MNSDWYADKNNIKKRWDDLLLCIYFIIPSNSFSYDERKMEYVRWKDQYKLKTSCRYYPFLASPKIKYLLMYHVSIRTSKHTHKCEIGKKNY